MFSKNSKADIKILLAISRFRVEENDYKCDIVLSFAGEDRYYAKYVADFLIEHDIKVFYDEYEQADLWGKNLYEHLSQVYQEARFYCVVFISKHYAQKNWTTHERRSAQARALKEREEYILPLRLDDSEIPGLLDTIAYIDLRRVSLDIVCQTLVDRFIQAQSENGFP